MSSIIKIPFHDSMKLSILKNQKTCTSRNKKYGVVGDYFILGDNIYFLTAITKCTLEEVATNFYKYEGFLSSEDFISMWNTLHPIFGYVPTKMVYVHWFKERVDTENSILQPITKEANK